MDPFAGFELVEEIEAVEEITKNGTSERKKEKGKEKGKGKEKEGEQKGNEEKGEGTTSPTSTSPTFGTTVGFDHLSGHKFGNAEPPKGTNQPILDPNHYSTSFVSTSIFFSMFPSL